MRWAGGAQWGQCKRVRTVTGQRQSRRRPTNTPKICVDSLSPVFPVRSKGGFTFPVFFLSIGSLNVEECLRHARGCWRNRIPFNSQFLRASHGQGHMSSHFSYTVTMSDEYYSLRFIITPRNWGLENCINGALVGVSVPSLHTQTHTYNSRRVSFSDSFVGLYSLP